MAIIFRHWTPGSIGLRTWGKEAHTWAARPPWCFALKNLPNRRGQEAKPSRAEQPSEQKRQRLKPRAAASLQCVGHRTEVRELQTGVPRSLHESSQQIRGWGRGYAYQSKSPQGPMDRPFCRTERWVETPETAQRWKALEFQPSQWGRPCQAPWAPPEAAGRSCDSRKHHVLKCRRFRAETGKNFLLAQIVNILSLKSYNLLLSLPVLWLSHRNMQITSIVVFL